METGNGQDERSGSNVFQEDEGFVAAVFHNTPAITRMHAKAPFGQTRDISNLISGDEEDRRDYLMRLSLSSIVIFGVFLIWAILLLMFKCLGKDRVGFLSGHPIQKPKPLEEEATHVEEENDEESNSDKCVETVSCEDEKNVSSVFLSIPFALDPEKGRDPKKDDDDEEQAASEPFFDTQSTPSERDVMDDALGKASSEENRPIQEQAPAQGDVLSEEFYDAQSVPSNRNIDDTITNPTTASDQLSSKWNREDTRSRRTLLVTRIIVIFSSVGIIVASILFLIYGVSGLGGTLDETRSAIDHVDGVVLQLISLMTIFLDQQNKTALSTLLLENYGRDWCPKKRDELLELCQNLLGACNFTEIPFQEEIDSAMPFLNKTRYLVFDQGKKIKGDLEYALEVTDSADNTLQDFEWAFLVSAIFVVILDIVVIAFVYTMIQAWRGKVTRCVRIARRFVITPVLLFFMFIGWLFSIIFIVAATVTADTCIDDPDARVVEILEQFRENFNSILFQFGIFIFKGCASNSFNPLFGLLGDAVDVLIGLLASLDELVTAVASIRPDDLQAVCGVSSSPITEAASALSELGDFIERLLLEAGGLFSCSTFHPIYTTIAYNAICYNAVDGLTWIFSTQLTIAVLTMVIATLRASCDLPEEYQVSL